MLRVEEEQKMEKTGSITSVTARLADVMAEKLDVMTLCLSVDV